MNSGELRDVLPMVIRPLTIAGERYSLNDGGISGTQLPPAWEDEIKPLIEIEIDQPYPSAERFENGKEAPGPAVLIGRGDAGFRPQFLKSDRCRRRHVGRRRRSGIVRRPPGTTGHQQHQQGRQ